MGQSNRCILTDFDLLVLLVGQRAIWQWPERSSYFVTLADCPNQTLAIPPHDRMLSKISIPLIETPRPLRTKSFIEPVLLHTENSLQLFAGCGQSCFCLLNLLGIISLVRVGQRGYCLAAR